MRILLLTQHFPPDPGPQSRRWGLLAGHFARHGHRVDVVVPRWSEAADIDAATLSPPGVSIRPVRSFVRGIRLQRRILNEALTALGSLFVGYRAAREEDVDVVIGTVPALPALPVALVIGRLTSIPVVADIRDAWPDILRNWRGWGDTGTAAVPDDQHGAIRVAMTALVPTASTVYTRLQRSADLVVTTTAALADVFRRRGMCVAAVRNTSFGLVPDSLPAQGPRRDGTLRVLYLGNVGRAQHLATAIRAAALCQQRGVPVRLRIVGDGAEAEAMRQFNARLGHPAELISRVSAEEVQQQYTWADTVLVCLRDWAGMEWTVPSKLYEILHSGRHVSASLRGEAATIIHDSGAGDVVPPENPEALADLWAELVADRDRLAVGERGNAWVAEHADSEDLGDRYLELLTAVVDDRRLRG